MEYKKTIEKDSYVFSTMRDISVSQEVTKSQLFIAHERHLVHSQCKIKPVVLP